MLFMEGVRHLVFHVMVLVSRLTLCEYSFSIKTGYEC